MMDTIIASKKRALLLIVIIFVIVTTIYVLYKPKINWDYSDTLVYVNDGQSSYTRKLSEEKRAEIIDLIGFEDKLFIKQLSERRVLDGAVYSIPSDNSHTIFIWWDTKIVRIICIDRMPRRIMWRRLSDMEFNRIRELINNSPVI